ncbi:hypothetical protein SSBR45G_52140 [Bradyrhizobium sp. SSBR45G]|uniref:GGDEF domain-containing protein n=1 Tax=unclassified Bradyrhizobium TaxID=2631580 RepID=UPI002342AF48|nr:MULTISPECIES: GGDEF domain-containing protein [unclassified Bradyrhizobium]GLH80305.1 hypothetical protein SSBR45G_52140 [Bradyrhizobium sp. SSBR45G]GLH87799.1 hypothetical protein SSBR45R_52590 [Bradyrhizobium sp. SSBR45R]
MSNPALPSRLDLLLRFSPEVEQAYEHDARAQRIAELRRSIAVGLCLFNVYNFTGVLLLDDVMSAVFVLRGLAVTPVSIALIWLIGSVNARTREWLMTIGVLNAFVVPIWLFYISDSAFSAYTFGEFPLTFVFGNMLLMLRFRFAILFTAAALALAVAAALMKAGLHQDLRTAFVIQIVTGAVLTLYANWKSELNRCVSFLREFDAREAAQAASEASRLFKDLSLTDPLTALPNRRALDSTLAAWFAEDGTVAVMMIDIDHFKAFNDHLGHPTGDDCLRQVAAALREVAGEAGAAAARFGGEEFTVHARGLSAAAAARLAEHVVERVRALQIPHPARPDGLAIVTISLGLVHVADAAATSPSVALARADDALYAAKRFGRNRWVDEADLRPEAMSA